MDPPQGPRSGSAGARASARSRSARRSTSPRNSVVSTVQTLPIDGVRMCASWYLLAGPHNGFYARSGVSSGSAGRRLLVRDGVRSSAHVVLGELAAASLGVEAADEHIRELAIDGLPVVRQVARPTV